MEAERRLGKWKDERNRTIVLSFASRAAHSVFGAQPPASLHLVRSRFRPLHCRRFRMYAAFFLPTAVSLFAIHPCSASTLVL